MVRHFASVSRGTSAAVGGTHGRGARTLWLGTWDKHGHADFVIPPSQSYAELVAKGHGAFEAPCDLRTHHSLLSFVYIYMPKARFSV